MVSGDMPTKKNQRGMSLIELMIALVMGLITIAATIALYLVIVKGSILAIQSTRLNYDVDSLVQLIVNDLRRAGYWADAVSGYNPTTNPFTTNDTDINITSDWDSTTSGNQACITYAYDADLDTNVDNDELFGFRLNSNGSVSLRLSANSVGVATSCTDANGLWEALTVTEGTEQVDITNLSFSLGGSSCGNVDDSSAAYPDVLCKTVINASLAYPSVATGNRLVGRRTVNINLDAQMGRDENIRKNANATVVVANDTLELK